MQARTVEYRYNKLKVIPRIVAMQVVAMILMYWTLLLFATREQHANDFFLGVIVFGLGWCWYLFHTALFIKMLVAPIYLSVDDDGTLKLRIIFKETVIKLERSTKVIFNNRFIQISSKHKLPYASKYREEISVFVIPGGILDVVPGEITVDKGERNPGRT